jgi:hypothetical protein
MMTTSQIQKTIRTFGVPILSVYGTVEATEFNY